MVSRRLLAVLLVIAVLLPVTFGVVVGVAWLLARMGDAGGSHVLEWIALSVAILWAVDLVALLLAVGINHLPPPKEGD